MAVRHWALTTLREKLIKIGAKVVSRARHVTFQIAEVAVPREVSKAIPERIGWLRLPVVVGGDPFRGDISGSGWEVESGSCPHSA